MVKNCLDCILHFCYKRIPSSRHQEHWDLCFGRLRCSGATPRHLGQMSVCPFHRQQIYYRVVSSLYSCAHYRGPCTFSFWHDRYSLIWIQYFISTSMSRAISVFHHQIDHPLAVETQLLDRPCTELLCSITFPGKVWTIIVVLALTTLFMILLLCFVFICIFWPLHVFFANSTNL